MLRSLARVMVRPGTRKLLAATASNDPTKTGRMFALQAQLPSLPVPPLQHTLDKYLLSVTPFITDDELQHTEKVVKDFGKSEVGQQLQRLLENKASQMDNWLSDWWLHLAYLDYRLPVVINSNPGIVLPVQDFRDQEGQLRFAAKLISGILDFKKLVDEKAFPVEYLGGKPLCMTQYYKILSSCRIPGRKQDSLVLHPSDKPNPPQHIVVTHNNHFFSLDVYSASGKRLTEVQILKQLYRIVEQSATRGPPVGILTTEGRNTWAKLHDKLNKDARNKASLEAIQRSIFLLCIDSPLPHTLPEGRFSLVSAQMLHGLGSKWNSGNRWFDKTLQFIIGDDGACGLNYEHSPAEGPPIAQLIDHAVAYCNKPSPQRTAPSKIGDPRHLPFHLDSDVQQGIEEACQRMDEFVSDVQSVCFKFDVFGKEFVKSQKLSPDAFIQVALQLAFYSLHKEAPATYESGSTRMFKYGRTDTIRSCSIASTEFSKAMQDASISNLVKVDLLHKAIVAHRMFTSETIQGKGVDRHLLGLKLTAIENSLNVPELFMDPTYAKSMTHRLSTSQVAAKSEAVLTFGPTAANGYGVCYNPQAQQFIISITAFNSSPETDASKLKTSLTTSLTNMHDLLLSTQKSKL